MFRDKLCPLITEQYIEVIFSNLTRAESDYICQHFYLPPDNMAVRAFGTNDPPDPGAQHRSADLPAGKRFRIIYLSAGCLHPGPAFS